ncbi:MAG: AMP-binding protein, partial [Clostridia bacterium]|nr:AMP-binding protein [Clostridia bacterium]
SILAHGLGRKHVALIGKLSYPWICSYLSLLACGSVVVPLDADWTEEDLAATVERADCEAVFCSNDIMQGKARAILQNKGIRIALNLDDTSDEDGLQSWMEAGRALRAEGDRSYESVRVNPGEMALLAFTSGTTGKGKGVMLNQTAILDDVSAALQVITATPKTIALLPAHHTFGSNLNIIGHLCYGAELYLSSGIRYLLKELKEQKPGHLILVPLFLESFRRKIEDAIRDKKMEKEFARLVKVSNALRKTGVDIRRKLFKGILDTFGGELSLVVSGGAPLSPSLVEFFDNIGITILNGYGITECAPVIAVNRNKQQKEGSVGMVLPLDTVKIREPNANGEGEVCVKGNNVMMGYYKDPEATEAAFDEDFYFRTGDIGKLDEEGWLYITGRMKNLIILSNGKNVYPEEIETTLSAIPGVGEVVVYEGESKRGIAYNTIVAEIFPDEEFLKKKGIGDAYDYFHPYIQDYNRTAVPYKKIGLLKIRNEDFPKNTLRKIMRFRIDKTVD